MLESPPRPPPQNQNSVEFPGLPESAIATRHAAWRTGHGFPIPIPIQETAHSKVKNGTNAEQARSVRTPFSRASGLERWYDSKHTFAESVIRLSVSRMANKMQ
jgi:hypothetical protein